MLEFCQHSSLSELQDSNYVISKYLETLLYVSKVFQAKKMLENIFAVQQIEPFLKNKNFKWNVCVCVCA